MVQEPKQVLSELLDRARTLARTHLARFARLEPGDCKEVYLFKDDKFCGVRFTLGAFRAEWRVEESVLGLFRGANPIDRMELGADRGTKAA